MKTNNICILGDGLLGSELHRQTGWDMISRKKDRFDITKPENWDEYFYIREHGSVMYIKYDTVINCSACTDTYSDDKQKHWDVNFRGVVDLSDFCTNVDMKLVHISTDYIYSNSVEYASEEDVPVHCRNWYGYTKLLGDGYAQLNKSNLIIRSTHKKEPFPYETAWARQWGNFDYVSIIGNLIIRLINKNVSGVYNVGTALKNMYSLAKLTRPNVIMNGSYVLQHQSTPLDVSMTLDKLNNILK